MAVALCAAATLSLAACGGGNETTATTAAAPAANATPATQRVARLDRIAGIGKPTSVAQPPATPGTSS